MADVDYRGSSGYGRSFRQALVHGWGVADTEDCALVARHLSKAGPVDPDSIIIYGESAGGYTALRALATMAVHVIIATPSPASPNFTTSRGRVTLVSARRHLQLRRAHKGAGPTH